MLQHYRSKVIARRDRSAISQNRVWYNSHSVHEQKVCEYFRVKRATWLTTVKEYVLQ